MRQAIPQPLRGTSLYTREPVFSRDTQPPAKLKAPPIRTSKGQSSTAPERPTCSIEGQRGDAQEGNTSWVLFGSFSQRERIINSSALQKSRCQSQAQSCYPAAQRTPPKLLPLSPQGTLPTPEGETQNTQPPAKLKAPPIRPSKGQSSTAPERPTCSIEVKGEMPKRGTPLGCSLVLSRSEKEQEPCSAPWKSCRQLQSTILS